jgi:hypothetical protein
MATDQKCEHHTVSATHKLGWYCCDCKEPLVSLLFPISRNTAAGALLSAMYKTTTGATPHA